MSKQLPRHDQVKKALEMRIKRFTVKQISSFLKLHPGTIRDVFDMEDDESDTLYDQFMARKAARCAHIMRRRDVGGREFKAEKQWLKQL